MNPDKPTTDTDTSQPDYQGFGGLRERKSFWDAVLIFLQQRTFPEVAFIGVLVALYYVVASALAVEDLTNAGLVVVLVVVSLIAILGAVILVVWVMNCRE
jgi:hypothetical protein